VTSSWLLIQQLLQRDVVEGLHKRRLVLLKTFKAQQPRQVRDAQQLGQRGSLLLHVALNDGHQPVPHFL